MPTNMSLSKHAGLLQLSALFITMFPVLSGPAFAQQVTPAETPPSATPAANAPGRGLEDIVVTARKRSENLQQIPLSVDAIPAAQIQARDLTSLEKIAATTPQLTVGRSSNGSGAKLTLRGIGTSSTSIGVEQSVATVVDGVYYGQGRIINEGFFDLDRVEILKGPQTLFFGKNATAGVISLTTSDPGSKAEYLGRLGYEFGASNPYVEAVISQPLTDTLGIRVAVRGSKMFDGYYKNKAEPVSYDTFDVATGTTADHTAAPAPVEQGKQKELIGRVTLKWKPTSRLTATIKASGDYNDTNNSAWNTVIFDCNNGTSSLNPDYSCKNGFTTRQNNIPDGISENLVGSKKNGNLFNLYKSYQLTGNINYNLDNISITSVTNYNHNSNKYACNCTYQQADNNGIWLTEKSRWHAFSEELRALTSFDSPLNFMIGGYYQTTRRDFTQAVVLSGLANSAAPAGLEYVGYQKLSYTNGRTLSAYGQAILKVTSKLEIDGGVRYIHETKNSLFTQPYVNPALTSLFVPESAPDGILRANQVFNNWSPEVTVSYKPSSMVMLYGSFKTAFKSGGFSNSADYTALSTNTLADLTFKPEKGKGFEAGVKTTLLERQLHFNVGIYSYKYTNLQVDFFNTENFSFVTFNAGSVRTKGVELESEYAPRALPGLTLRGSLNYNLARYRNFLGPCYAGQTPAEGCTLVGRSNAPFQDLSGQPTAIAPKWTATAGLSYDQPVGRDMKIGFSVDSRYSSSYLGSGFGNPLSVQHRYALLDAGMRVGQAEDRWEIALIGKNLTNHFYALDVQDSPQTGSGTGTPAGVRSDLEGLGALPRTVALQLMVKY